ncbi:hypothetical protein [Prauserella halophila]|uniref:hypothetical protein n=1 Tax=Prauserella halophila TaxID=185641 RepID=UPI0020A2B88D|nr:hypothetical protein [Prauserella halophila]
MTFGLEHAPRRRRAFFTALVGSSTMPGVNELAQDRTNRRRSLSGLLREYWRMMPGRPLGVLGERDLLVGGPTVVVARWPVDRRLCRRFPGVQPDPVRQVDRIAFDRGEEEPAGVGQPVRAAVGTHPHREDDPAVR